MGGGSFEYLESKKMEVQKVTDASMDEMPWMSSDQLLMAYCWQPLAPDCAMSKRAEKAQEACIRTCEKMKWTKVGACRFMCARRMAEV